MTPRVAYPLFMTIFGLYCLWGAGHALRTGVLPWGWNWWGLGRVRRSEAPVTFGIGVIVGFMGGLIFLVLSIYAIVTGKY